MQVHCAFCDGVLEAAAEDLGQQISCPHCTLDFELTAALIAEEETAAGSVIGSWFNGSLSTIISATIHTVILVLCALYVLPQQVNESVGNEVALEGLPIQQTLTTSTEPEQLETEPTEAESDSESLSELEVEIVSTDSGGGSGDLEIEELTTSGASGSRGTSLSSFTGDGPTSAKAARSGDKDAFSCRAPPGGQAVTRGSFTAWTVPTDPLPRMNYMIVIQIKLPRRVRRYTVSDLTGIVIGTDSYRQIIPNGAMTTRNEVLVPITLNQELEIRSNQVQLLIRVPGGATLVRDRIDIQSKVLSEQQTLEIVF